LATSKAACRVCLTVDEAIGQADAMVALGDLIEVTDIEPGWPSLGTVAIAI
jgi:hypothetical protein